HRRTRQHLQLQPGTERDLRLSSHVLYGVRPGAPVASLAMQLPLLTRRQVLVSGVVGVTTLMAPLEALRASGSTPAAASGTLVIGKDLTVNRMGFGAMRITGADIWGEPKDPAEARQVLHKALDLGVNFIDTADAYGPDVSERLIAEALHPYPK